MDVPQVVASDGMSEILAFAKSKDLMITGLTNIQSIRTADIAGVSAVIYCRGKRPDKKVVEFARLKKIPVLVTEHGHVRYLRNSLRQGTQGRILMAAELLRESYEIQGRNFDKAGEVSGEIKVLLRDLGIDAASLRRLVIVAFEAEMNVVMYARRGTMTLILTDKDISLEVTDEGPGIPDIELALQEGYSTASDEMREMGFGFGMGLPNMKKNSDEFRIESEVGQGDFGFLENQAEFKWLS